MLWHEGGKGYSRLVRPEVYAFSLYTAKFTEAHDQRVLAVV